jgi:hypothetical protein
LSITTTTHTTRPLHTRKKNDKDNYLLPLCRQDNKKGKELRAKASHHLLIVLYLLIVADLLLIIIIIVVNSSRTNTKGSQLSRNQRGIWVGDGRGGADRDIWELKEWLILLTVTDLLVAPNNLQALLHDIYELICAPARAKDTP